MTATAPHPAVPLHFGPPERWLHGWYHAPAGGAARAAGVVLCNPIGDDCIRAHRSFRHLAERLSSAGFAVLRFDFHGTGDSSGDERMPDRAREWLADIAHATFELRARSGVTDVALVGLRLGATLAMAAAARGAPVDSLVLWSPYLGGGAFVTESLRLHKMHKMIEPHSFTGGPSEYPDGEEALGFFLSAEAKRDLAAIDLLAASQRPSQRALVIGATSASAEAPLVERLRALGVETEHRHLPGHKFLIAIPHNSEVPAPILETIVSWLDAAHPARAAAAATDATDDVRLAVESDKERPEPGMDEEPLRFGERGRLFGILGRPREKPPVDRPAILLLSAGCVHRIGPHRIYTQMARRWTRLGFPVLRLDFSGIGDSAAAAGCLENLCYPPSAVTDVQEAMARVRDRLGVRRFVVAGLCSGGDIAFRLGLEDPRVAATLMLNPRTFYVNDADMVAAYARARLYHSSFLRPGRWLAALRGEVDYRRAARLLLPSVKGVIEPRIQRLIERTHPTAAPAQTDVPGCLRLIAERGVDTFLLVSEHDPGIEFVDESFGDRMRALSSVRGFRREDIRGTDHTFTSVWAQGRVSDLLTEHLAARYLA